jgi:hypothetical protein
MRRLFAKLGGSFTLSVGVCALIVGAGEIALVEDFILVA